MTANTKSKEMDAYTEDTFKLVHIIRIGVFLSQIYQEKHASK